MVRKYHKAQSQPNYSRPGCLGATPARLTFQPRPDWHAAERSSTAFLDEVAPLPRNVLDEAHQHAKSLLEAENKVYADINMCADSSHRFLSTITSSGTLEDRVSALTLLIQKSPLHNMKALETLVGLARKGNRKHALNALSALKDLFGQGEMLPSSRKLRTFAKQPALLAILCKAHSERKGSQPLPLKTNAASLICGAYEDWLKRAYFEVLTILEGWCNDVVDYTRTRAITFAYELLREKPEQEENLLRLLINKLGDTEKKTASHASYLLLQLQILHPAMKSVIINGIHSECLFRPHQSAHARYYAIITLNQTILRARDVEIANKLLDIYFAFFLVLLKAERNPEVGRQTDMQGKGCMDKGKANVDAKATRGDPEEAMIAESQLRDKLIAGVLTGINRAFPYSSTDNVAFEHQLQSIFRITHSSNFNATIQALLLLQRISASKRCSTDRFYRTLYASLLDPRLLHSSKQVMYLNLLYRSLKADVSVKRVQAFVKRLLQIVMLHEPAFACGVLYLVHELGQIFPRIKAMLDTAEWNDGDEEHFVDVPEDDKHTESPLAITNHVCYDGHKRDPEHAHAEVSCSWELVPLQLHFHPSVSLFASRLLSLTSRDAVGMPSKPDLVLHSLTHFLDRFAYRGARLKKSREGHAAVRGSSSMQPIAGSAVRADLLVRMDDQAARVEVPVNSQVFRSCRPVDVPADKVFFHRYFERNGARVRKENVLTGQDPPSEDGNSEAEIWTALVGGRPDAERMDGEDDDELKDLEQLMGVYKDESDERESGDDNVNVGDMADAGKEMGKVRENGYCRKRGDQRDSSEDKDCRGQTKGAMKRRKLKHLPTLANIEDYERLLEDDSDGALDYSRK